MSVANVLNLKERCYTVYGICLHLWGWAPPPCEMLGGDGPPGQWNPSYQQHTPIQLILWEYDPLALKCFAASTNQLYLLREFMRMLFVSVFLYVFKCCQNNVISMSWFASYWFYEAFSGAGCRGCNKGRSCNLHIVMSIFQILEKFSQAEKLNMLIVNFLHIFLIVLLLIPVVIRTTSWILKISRKPVLLKILMEPWLGIS